MQNKNIITKGLAVKTMRNTKQKGFTLIELLVVIAIIGLLASVVLLSLNSARQKSRDAKRLADVRQIASAFELYFNDCGGYPIEATAVVVAATDKLFSGTGADCGDDSGSSAVNGGIGATAGGTTYLGQFPVSPTPQDGTCTAAQNSYTYTAAAAATYTFTFCLGNLTGGYAAGVKTLSPSGIQ